MTAIVSTKGQIVIPHDIRKALGIHPGDKVTVKSSDGRIVMEKATGKPKVKLKLIKGKMPVLQAPPGAESLTPEMVREIAQI